VPPVDFTIPVPLKAACLALNVLQSVELKAPLEEAEDKPKESSWVAKLKPFAVPKVTALCLAAVLAATSVFALTLACVK